MDRVKVDHINAQSLLANKEEVNLLVNERDTDILCVSETWLPPEIRDKHIAIPNYVSYRCDAGRGGGVCIYVRDVFKVTPVNINIAKPKGKEDVSVSVKATSCLL